MKHKKLKYFKVKAVVGLAILVGFYGYPLSSHAQVYYPSTPDYDTAALTTQTESLTQYATPASPVRVPTIPPNGAYGLEHQSAFVIPTPRVITAQKMEYGVANVVSATRLSTYSPMLGTARITAQRAGTPIASAPYYSSSSVEPYYSGSSYLEEEHEPSFNRDMTAVPTTTYSDELPVIVSISASS